MEKTNKPMVLERTGKSDLSFKGRELAASTSNPDGIKNRWTELKVFKTVSGRYITQILGFSNIKGEVTRSTVDVADTPEDIPNLLGFGYLAKEIYRQLRLMFDQRL